MRHAVMHNEPTCRTLTILVKVLYKIIFKKINEREIGSKEEAQDNFRQIGIDFFLSFISL